MLRTLGHDLITNEIVALQELVKNAYDADATSVTIEFEDLAVPPRRSATVVDNGTGMSLETLLGAWMEPATNSKVKNTRSGAKRRVTGEKGIGRFASSRVAGVLELSSVSEETHRRTVARFDWGRFDDEASYLDEIECEWREEPAVGAEPGTTLRLVGLRDDWSRKDGAPFVALRSELARLVSPVAPESDFKILLEVPEPFERFSGEVTSPAFLGKPMYWLAGKMLADGTIDAVYVGPDEAHQEIRENGERPKVIVGKRAPQCGVFSFEFRVWDRSSEDLRPVAEAFGSTLRDIKRDLDAASGIAIYRDGFRVLLPEDADWLRLDIRRVQNPTMRVSNNQVVGVVSISRDENPGLIDQTNRQGIVDSQEFDDFRIAVKMILSKLEIRRDIVRRPAEPEPSRPAGIFGKISITPIREYVAGHYAADAELNRVVNEADRTIEDGVTEVKAVLVRYRRLATLGQLVDGILHEGRTPLAGIANAVRFLEKDIANARVGSILTKPLRDKLTKRGETILQQTRVLGELFRRIAPFSSRQRGRPSPSTMERILADTVALLRKEITDVGATIQLPDGSTPVTVDMADMQGIFRNLFENALYWLGRVPPQERLITVTIESGLGELQVFVSDNGPGVPDEIRDRIMQPYFTTRPDGEGLGLAIAGELALEYDGALDLMADGPLNGATFRVTLRRSIG